MIDDDDNESIKRMFMYQLTTSDITKSKKSELCIFPSSLQRSPHIFFVSSCAEKSHSFSGDISALKHTHPDKKDPVYVELIMTSGVLQLEDGEILHN